MCFFIGFILFKNDVSVILIDDENDDYDQKQRELLDKKGQMLYTRVREQHPEWDEVEVQMLIFNEIDKAHQEKRDIVTKDVLNALKENWEMIFHNFIW